MSSGASATSTVGVGKAVVSDAEGVQSAAKTAAAQATARGPWGSFAGLRPPAGTFSLVDMTESWVIADAELRCAAGWSPFAGMRVRGRVREVRIGGALAYDGERVLAQPGSGRNLRWS